MVVPINTREMPARERDLCELACTREIRKITREMHTKFLDHTSFRGSSLKSNLNPVVIVKHSLFVKVEAKIKLSSFHQLR